MILFRYTSASKKPEVTPLRIGKGYAGDGDLSMQ